MIVPEPALLIDGEQRTLIVSDVHVGFEASMASRGVRLDSLETARKMGSSIAELAATNRASKIVLLGDTKSGTSRIRGPEWDAIPEFLGIVGASADVVIVPGNHDAGITKLAPEGVQVSAPFGLVLDDTLLTHGHVMPQGTLSGVSQIIMGHAHPALRDDSSVIGGRRVWASMRIRKDAIFPSARGELELTVMPSYNWYVAPGSGRASRRGTSPILGRARDAVISAKIVTLDGVIIGDASMLDCVI